MTERQSAALVLLALAAFFTSQTALRVILGGSFEGDEAEMVLLARDWQLAAGSQPPLYNWWQALFFDLFGVNTVGLILAKNLVLFITYAAMFLALRPVSGMPLAAVGALSLALIPNLAWWAQRTGSHSIALAAMTALTVAAVLHLIRHPGTRAYLLFGLAIGLGGLAKPNYWLVPPALVLAGMSMAALRPVFSDRRILLSAAVALAVVALPYAAMLTAPEAAFEDLGDFSRDAAARLRWLQGLGHVAAGGLLELMPALVAIGLALALGGRAGRCLRRPRPEEAFLLRAAVIGLALLAAGVIFGNVGFFRGRWMLPLFILGVPPLMMVVFRAASERALRNFFRAVAGLALLLLAGMADVRLRGAGSDSLRVDLLADAIEAQVEQVPLLLGPHYYTGNLLLHRPGWEALPPYPTDRLATASGQVLVVGEDAGRALNLLRMHGYSGETVPAPVLAASVELPYRFTQDETREVTLLLFDLGATAE